jgi:uncharacterized protein DUF3592
MRRAHLHNIIGGLEISTYNADVILLLSFRWTDPTTWPWVVWVWLAFLLVGAVKPIWRKIKSRLVNSWPSVTGKIERVDVNEPKGFLGLKTSNRPRYFAEITYSYGVGGNTYTGTNRREFGDQDEAWDFLRELKGKAVVVHYNPGKPGASSLSEPSLEVLLQTRPPVPPGQSRAATRTIPLWIRPFLWLFVCLSLLGLVLSLYVHINALMGKQMPSIFWGLHVGIFVVWGPAVFAAQKRVGSTARKDFWKAVLKGAPAWMRYATYGFLSYAFFGSLLLMAIAPEKGVRASAPASEWRGFSAGWMAFYFAAFAILYAAAIQPLGPRCVNGHALLSGQSLCPQCGQPALPPNDPIGQS